MKRVVLAAGLIVLLAAWLSPLPGLVQAPFARHMIVHVAVIALAAPLVGAWLAGVLASSDSPLLAPLPASAIGFGVVWLWHLPLLHGLAALLPWIFALEQLSFFGAGLLLWTSALLGARSGGDGAGILALLITSMHLVLLGTLLTLAPLPLYTHGIHTLGEMYGQLAGQRLGGLLMLLGAGIPYLAGALLLVHRLLRRPQPARALHAAPRAAGLGHGP